MEMFVYPVQMGRFGFLGKDVNVRTGNLTSVIAVRMLIDKSVKIFQIRFGNIINAFVSKGSIQRD